MNGQTCSCVISVAIILALVITPCILGYRISVLDDRIRAIEDTSVVQAVSTKYPPVSIVCMSLTNNGGSISDILVAQVNGSQKVALQVQNAYMENTSGPKNKKSCSCQRLAIAFVGAQKFAELNEGDINCALNFEWSPYNKTIYAYGSDRGLNAAILDHVSPAQKIMHLNQEIAGCFVGVYICCGILAFLFILSLFSIIIRGCIDNRTNQVAPCLV